MFSVYIFKTFAFRETHVHLEKFDSQHFFPETRHLTNSKINGQVHSQIKNFNRVYTASLFHDIEYQKRQSLRKFHRHIETRNFFAKNYIILFETATLRPFREN